jgi:DNA repair protein SbcC/Rad50
VKIEKLKINGIRSYLEQSITFEDGVTVIAGPNGSGKSSMLESIFIALYGSKAIVDPSQKIGDFINNDTDHANVSLTFNHLGSKYEISNGYRVNSRTISASNSGSILKKDGMPIAQQFGNTYETVNDILKMDENAFRNCVYIRQGEIDILINATPQERQRMIDDLLQIGRLEEYASRSKSALTSINRIVEKVKSLLDDKKSNLQIINESDPWQQMNTLLSCEKTVKAKINETNEKKDAVNEKINEIDNKIKEYGSINADIQNLVTKNNELTDLKRDQIGEITQINESINGRHQKIGEMKIEINNLKKDVGIDDIETNVDEVVNELVIKTSEMSNDITRIKGDISTKKTIVDSINGSLERNKDIKKKINTNISTSNVQIEEDTKGIIGREIDIGNKQNSIQEILNSYAVSTIEGFKTVVSKLDIDVQDKLELKTQIEKEVNKIDADICSFKAQIGTIEESIKKENDNKESEEARLAKVNRDLKLTNNKIAELNEQYLSTSKEIEENIHKTGRNIPQGINRDHLKEIQDELITQQRNLIMLDTSYRSNIATINEQIEKDDELCEQGICPTCRQKVDASHIQHDIDEKVSKRKEYEAKLIEVRNNLNEIDQHICEVGIALDTYDELIAIKSDLKTRIQMLDPYNNQKQSIQDSMSRVEKNAICLNEQKSCLIKNSNAFKDQLQQKEANAYKCNEEYQKLKNELECARNSLTNIANMDATINLKKSEIEGLKRNIENARNNIYNLEKELCSLDKEVEELNSQLKKVDSELMMLLASLEDAIKLNDQTKVIYESS